MLETSVWTVALAALVTAVATGLRVLPFLNVSRSWLGISNAVAAGLMLGGDQSSIVAMRDFRNSPRGIGGAGGTP